MIISTLKMQTISPDLGFPYSANLFLNLCTWRDKNNGLVGRVTTQLALVGVALIALIESTVIIPLVLTATVFYKKEAAKGIGLLILTNICGHLYAQLLNLFVQNITWYLIDLDVWIVSPLKEEALGIACMAGNYAVTEALLKKDWVDPHRIDDEGIPDALIPTIYGQRHLNPLFQLNEYEKSYLEFKNIGSGFKEK